MDYEKKYKEALERAREFQKSKDGLCVLTAESIFPELKESEDERIRKELIFYLGDMPEDTELRNGVTNRDVLTWLEKQGEKKPTDKVEPKFKVGDWIVNNEDGSIGQITDIIYDESGYGYNHTNGWLHSVFEKDFHLWTIQDAKDGDVLYLQKDGKEHIIIYKGVIKERFRTFVSAYCAYNGIVDAFCFADVSRYTDVAYGGIVPATKEQRDLLFQKMKEEGYEFDFEKKELKKIHVIDEGKAEMDYCFTKMMAGEKANPTWSDEDKMMLNELIIGFYAYKDLYPNFWKLRTDEIIEWLKKKKDEHTTDNG